MADPSPDRAGAGAALWRHRARVAEAMVLLAIARALVALVPLSRWSRWFGAVTGPAGGEAAPVSAPAALRARRVARAVGQAARHLPFETKCLPRAMVAGLMLRRRAIPAALCIGVLPAAERGTDDDLHAWLSCGGQTIVGGGEQAHAVLLTLR